ncbi:MAG: serine/threonine protein kinase [Deltaproteobacteria bacterium]|nr:serine/threonine protein kinase [Deltaproteobacteria bacterium]
MALSPGEALSPGVTVGDLRIGACLAIGPSGAVHECENRLAGKRCAIRLFSADLALDPVHWGRYTNDALRVGQLSLPSIATIFTTGEAADGQKYVVEELVGGTCLREVLTKHAPLSRRVVVPLMRELCGALAMLHQRGHAHRWLHAGNVRVFLQSDRPPAVKLLDFGQWHLQPPLAELGRRPAAAAACVAPETLRGGHPGAEADVYALGVLLYQMTTGRLPFLGETFALTLEKAGNDQLVPPAHWAQMPPELDQAIVRALERDPRRRTRSVEALLGELDPAWITAQHAAPVQATSGPLRDVVSRELTLPTVEALHPWGLGERVSREDDVDAAPAEAPRKGRRGRRASPAPRIEGLASRRAKWLYLGLGIALVLFAGALLLLFSEDGGDPTDDTKRPGKSVPRPPRRSPPGPGEGRPPSGGRTPRPGPALAGTSTPAAPSPPTPSETADAAAPGGSVARDPAVRPLSRAHMARGSELRRYQPPTFGSLRVTGVLPRAQIFLDGQLVGRGPQLTLPRVASGRHRLHLVVDGVAQPAREVQLAANAEVAVSF